MNRMSKKMLVIIVFLIVNITNAQDYVFEHISSNDGLSNNLVRDITQDKQGYLWFATSAGLNRFDGHSFNIYKTIIGDSMSLSDSRIAYVTEDTHGYIWVGSSMGKIHRVDPVTHRVYNLYEQKILPEGTLVQYYFMSSDGDMWLVLNKGVVHVYYPYEDKSIIKTHYFNTENGLPHNKINFVGEESENRFWFGTANGLVKIEFTKNNKADYNIELFHSDSGVKFTAYNRYKNKIYFGTNLQRIFVYDTERLVFNDNETINIGGEGVVSNIKNNKFNQLLIGTSSGEVILYDILNNYVSVFNHNNTRILRTSFVNSIFPDKQGLFWIVTDDRGIYQFNPNTKLFKYFGLNYQNRMFLGEPDKQILLEDSNNDLWVGINGGGLFRYDRKNDKFIQYQHDPNNTSSISSDIILSMYEDRSKNLWIGTSYGGVNKISLKKRRMQQIKPVENPQTDFDNYIRSLTTDVLGNIWLGSKAGKIYIYHGTSKIGTIPDDLTTENKIPGTNVYCLYFDSDHNLWIGTKGNGIYIIKSLLNYINNLGSKNIEVVHLKHNAASDNSLSSDNIYCIRQDIHGQYWIGAFQGGLDLLKNPFGDISISHFYKGEGQKGGIVSVEVRDLMFDRAQNLWIASSDGISILESKYLKAPNKQFINVSPSIQNTDGLSGKVVYQIKQKHNNDIMVAMLDGGINILKAENFDKREFKWVHQKSEVLSSNVYCIEEDNLGNIWMGTDNGLFRLNNDDGIVEKFPVNSSFLPLTFSETCSEMTIRNEMVLGSNDGFILFNPDSIKKDSVQFPLRFSKLEINGEHITNQNSTILETSIEIQKHISLSASQNNITLHFSVLDFDEPNTIQYSYFLDGYDNYWSNPSVTNSASYRKLIPGEYKLYVKGTNSSGTWIKEEAVLEIQIRSTYWQSTTGRILMLLLVSLVITVSSVFFYRQVVMQNRIRIEKAITEKRMEYYTNISHEFKTPLSLILNPVDEIIASHKSSDFARQKAMQIKKSATYLKQLIEQILDFRKIREGKMQLKVSELNIVEFFREIYLVFLPLSKKLGIKFEFDYNLDDFMGYLDIKQLEKIAYNLLSNAFRHTPEGKHVRLIVEVQEITNQLKLSVQDEGQGIDEQELPKLFDRFNNSSNSSGIGLFYTREIVNLHKGTIEAYNNKDKGATFVVTMPINRASYSESEINQSVKSTLVYDLNSISDIETLVAINDRENEIRHHVVDYMETILIVEDNIEMRGYLSRKLSDRYKIIEAENGEVGIEKAREHAPAIIISDVIMPKMNGYEMTKILKHDFDTSHIPIVLLTAESSEDAKIKGMQCGADDYVVKPFNFSYLNSKIDNIIALRKKLKERFERDIKSNIVINEEVVQNEQNFIEQVQNIIMENLSNQLLNVEFLVEKMQFSRTLFFKKIKASSGYAPNEFIRLIRMKEAARLLLSSNKSISEISLLVGFNDSNYFSKSFKKHYGDTPSVYKSKKQNRSNL